MDSLEKARNTQLANIESKTGKSLDELRLVIQSSGLVKHGEIRSFLIEKFSLGYGDAGMLVHFAQNSDGQSEAEAENKSMEQILDEIYTGAKGGLRPIHERLIVEIEKIGEFTPVPKKGYISLRRKRQFAMLGPGTKGRFEVGLNLKGINGTERLLAQPGNLMCQFKVFLTSVDEIDPELLEWLREAYQASA
jgi:hypothetical protein